MIEDMKNEMPLIIVTNCFVAPLCSRKFAQILHMTHTQDVCL